MKTLWIALSLSAVALTGCGKSLKEYAEAASEEIGMPVVLETTEDDACAYKQMKKFYKDWNVLEDAQKSVVRDQLRSKYSSIALGQTVAVGTAKLERSNLSFVQRVCRIDYGYGWGPGYGRWRGGPGSFPPGWAGWRSPYYGSCGNSFVDRKQIGNDIQRTGKTPATQLNKGARLEIIGQSNAVSSIQRNFYTPYYGVYTSINDVKSPFFEASILAGEIWQEYPTRYEGVDCGQLASLPEMVQAARGFYASQPEMDDEDRAPANWVEKPVADGEILR